MAHVLQSRSMARATGGVQLYASPSGNDTNDCLTPDTACTLKGACSFRSRFATYFSGHIAINLADDTYSSTDANRALCTVEGNQGASGNVSSETILAGAAFHWNFSTGATFATAKTISIPSAVSFAGGAFLAATGNVTIDLTADHFGGGRRGHKRKAANP